jgi:hypothetical protein
MMSLRQFEMSGRTADLIQRAVRMNASGQVFEEDLSLRNTDEVNSLLSELASAVGADLGTIPEVGGAPYGD